MQPTDFFYGLLSGLLSGVAVGWVVERYRLKNSLKVERMKRLTPQIEIIHPIVEELCADVDYFAKRQLRLPDGEDDSILEKIITYFAKYNAWYLGFQSKGFKPELGATSKPLLNRLTAIFAYSLRIRKYGGQYLLNEIDEISESLKASQSLIEQFLTS
jgi:hypothetical protein